MTKRIAIVAALAVGGLLAWTVGSHLDPYARGLAVGMLFFLAVSVESFFAALAADRPAAPPPSVRVLPPVRVLPSARPLIAERTVTERLYAPADMPRLTVQD